MSCRASALEQAGGSSVPPSSAAACEAAAGALSSLNSLRLKVEVAQFS